MYKVRLCDNDHAEGEMLMLNSDRKPIITGLFEVLCWKALIGEKI